MHLRILSVPIKVETVFRLIVATAIAMLIAGCSLPRHYEAAVMLADLMAAQKAPDEKFIKPDRTVLDYEVSGRRYKADLYLPRAAPPEAGIVLVPGVVPEGNDDPLLIDLAVTLSRARFAVLVPQMPGFRQLAISASDAQDIADAFAHLADRPDLTSGGRIGIVAFSYAVGPAVLAALMPSVRDRARFVFGVGGYYHFPHVIRYITTGWFEHEGRWHWSRPNDYGKLVLVNAAKPFLSDRDREIIDVIVERRLRERTADLSDLGPQLGPEGKAVMDLATNTDPMRFSELYASLPRQMQAEISRLSLHDKNLDRLHARILLIHGKNDSFIPWSESADLAAAVPNARSRVFLMNSMLGHVDLGFSHMLTKQFFSDELPDFFRMWLALDSLLAERSAGEDS